MTNIYDAVRVAIEHRLGEDMKSTDILANIPAYVRRAVFKMQQTNVIEPTQLEYSDLDLQQYFNSQGEDTYDYISLPEDYIELHKIFVNGTVPEWYVSPQSIRAKAKDNQDTVYYSISSVVVDGGNERILALANVPSGGVITIQYHANVTDDMVKNLPERYWEAVIKQIESYINLPGTQKVIFRTPSRFFGGGRRNGRLVR